MERREFIALLGSAAALMPSTAGAKPSQSADQVAERISGTWDFVSSVDTRNDGSTFNRWGADTRGILMIDASGHFSQIIVGSESRMFGAKTFCAFGSYAFDAVEKAFITEIKASSVSRLIGSTQRRVIVSLTADALTYVNPVTAAGTKAEVVWKRLG
jgi:hypothetical protein